MATDPDTSKPAVSGSLDLDRLRQRLTSPEIERQLLAAFSHADKRCADLVSQRQMSPEALNTPFTV